MSGPKLSSETLHASCVARNSAAILIAGRSGAGKSDLALRLIDRGASLVSDDYTLVRWVNGRLVASPPPAISGKMEIRGLGLLDFEYCHHVPICLYVDLDREVARLPDLIDTITIAGVSVPVIALESHHASAPIKVELALDRFGLKP